MKKEEILKFYQNYRLYIFPSIVALSCLILIILVIYPQTIKLITNQKTGEEIANKSKLLGVRAQALESYDSEDLSKKVDFALGSYPTEKDYVSALDLLQNIITKSDFGMTAMTLEGGSSQSANAQSYSIRLELLGPNKLLPILLSKIESSPRLMRVSSVETGAGRDPQGVPVSLSVDVLYSATPRELGSVDAPLPELSPREEEVISKLASEGISVSTSVSQPTPQLGPRGGKENPFE